MPDVAEPAYWSRNLIASAAAALAAEGADASSSSGGGSNSGRPRNPTLGPQAGVFLQRVQQQAEAQQQQQQQASSGEGASRRGDLERQQQEAAMAAAAGGGSGAVEDVAGQAHPNPPFWWVAPACIRIAPAAGHLGAAVPRLAFQCRFSGMHLLQLTAGRSLPACRNPALRLR
jgi:hypothetical protein